MRSQNDIVDLLLAHGASALRVPSAATVEAGFDWWALIARAAARQAAESGTSLLVRIIAPERVSARARINLRALDTAPVCQQQREGGC